ncbi:hypothetical protein EK21DRAFT_61182 [Setomelanomma holmii]|uniref:Fe2OG dioxygenase domain-containing protein n=1 Tax=Setomelanomma holmii TaxID=210430 RepID=A0A9P4LM97_9PLEO|nr:hypothetical protein EK21DRAFT_61182 [Setomelanomma holmii]
MTIPDKKHGLEAFRIAGLPPDFYYIPNFITAEEEASILHKIPAQRWTHLTHRRLQAHPSTLTKNNTLLAAPLPVYLTRPIIPRFKELSIFDNTPYQQPNHVLINEYKPGEGIMPHEDGNAYAPVVATVSLGGSLCLDIIAKPTSPEQTRDLEADATRLLQGLNGFTLPTRIFQEPRSLLITTGDAYRDLMHGIEAIEIDEDLNADTVANWDLVADRESIEKNGGQSMRETRISLTYRDVLRVSSAASKVLGGFGKR